METTEKEIEKKIGKYGWVLRYIVIPVLMIMLSVGSSLATFSFKSGGDAERLNVVESKVVQLDQTDRDNKVRSDQDHDILISIKTKVDNIEKTLDEIKSDMKFRTRETGNKNETNISIPNSIFGGGYGSLPDSVNKLQ